MTKADRKLKRLVALKSDAAKSAKMMELMYVTDKSEGIQRIKKGKDFNYIFKEQPVGDTAILERIKKLVIPPAWENVWICAQENGHIQVTGIDAKGRKQYRYHSTWNDYRNKTKYFRLYDFGLALPSIRKTVEKDLANKDLNKQKVLALVISLLERTNIRVGNNGYEKLYGSYGLTTLNNKHLSWHGSEMVFSFKGKKGVYHKITLKNNRLSKLVKACKDIPGKELFQFYDSNGERHSIDSHMVNQYIKDATGKDFSAKDFRTWSGSLAALFALQSFDECVAASDYKKNIVAALDEVSSKLGNTRNVCKKYYVHPSLLEIYEGGNMAKFLSNLDDIETNDGLETLTKEEKTLMGVLKKAQQ